MAVAPTEQPEQIVMPEAAELLIKEAREKSRRRRVRLAEIFTLLVTACLVAIGIVHYASTPARTTGNHKDGSAQAVTCPSARVKLLGVSAIPGGLGHAGLLVRASLSSSSACTMSGYPIVGVELTTRSTAMASDMRLGYLGGFANVSAPLPRLSVSSHPRVVSFTIQMAGCNGPRPYAKAIQITLPGLSSTVTARSMYEAGVGVFRGFGIYCGHLFVTPLVKGSSGSGN